MNFMLNGRQYATAHAHALYRGTVTNRPLQGAFRAIPRRGSCVKYARNIKFLRRCFLFFCRFLCSCFFYISTLPKIDAEMFSFFADSSAPAFIYLNMT